MAAVASESVLAGLLMVFAGFWVAVSLWLLTWRVWRWMTYRVGVRLFITYLLIGVLPLFFAMAFAAFGLYILMGQYTSVRVGSEFDRFGWSLLDDCEDVIEIASDKGPESAFSALDELASDPPHPLSRVSGGPASETERRPSAVSSKTSISGGCRRAPPGGWPAGARPHTP